MTGIAPSEYMDDELLFAAFAEQAEQAQWTELHELAALNAELTHAVFRQLIASAGHKPPAALKLPRPHDEKPDAIVMRPSDFAKALMSGDV